ncbi:hypothetical protein C2W62_41265 [Candidatus Entotheonella serta]|nr:hypothetical protein C2W62_41265 [Candidatus Entotheonella serta]
MLAAGGTTTSSSQGHAPDIGLLLRDLRHDAFWIRERAAEALGDSRSPEAVSGLLSALADATSTVRERVAEALARIGSDQALAGLKETLGEKEANDVLRRVWAKQAVDERHQIRLEQITDALHHALSHGAYAERWRAAQTLWRLEGSQMIEALLQVLQVSDVEHRAQGRAEASPNPPASRPDEYMLFDALSRQDFQAAWQMARDLARRNSDVVEFKWRHD